MQHIGIRREDKDRWETRVPLLPSDVRLLGSAHPLRFVVQPSSQRVFSDDEYREAGALVADNLGDCPIVLAVKEIPPDLLQHGKTYVFFSHTIKGQRHNMPLLRRLIELECQLIDYERIRDASGARLIYFSRFAGLAGAIDTLWALGRRLAWEGLEPNPFSRLSQTYRYGTLQSALEAMNEIGALIARDGLPNEICPFVIGVAGYGNVSRGAQEVLSALGARIIAPQDLDDLFAQPVESRVAYAAVFTEREMVCRRDAASDFDLADYLGHPESCEGRFEQWLPRLTALINCIYWDARYPRLVTKAAVHELFSDERPLLRIVGDVSCDIEGSIEFTLRETSIDDPVYVYDPFTDTIQAGVAGRGPVVLAVGNLPCELPREASAAFSAALTPYVPALAAADFGVPYGHATLPPELSGALILHQGRLTPDYAHLESFLHVS